MQQVEKAINFLDLRFCYLADSFQRFYYLSVVQRYERFSFLQNPGVRHTPSSDLSTGVD